MMNGWILYVGEMIPELKRSIEEASSKGIKIDVINPKDVDIVLDSHSTKVYVKGVMNQLPQFVIAGFIEENNYYSHALLQNLETLGALCINTAQTVNNSGDKLKTHQLLAANGIPTPKTILVRPGMNAEDLMRHFNLPIVLKVLQGSKGKGVLLVKSKSELDNILQLTYAGGLHEELIAQEYIAESHGKDIRVLVIDKKPVAAMLRRSASVENFKSNFSQGGSVESWQMSDDMIDICNKTIKVIGLNIGGIDLLFSKDGFVVCEVNAMPGFQGIEKSNDINVPAEIFKSIDRQLMMKKKTPIQMREFLKMNDEENIIDKLKKMSELESYLFFKGLCEIPAETQKKVLLDIINKHKTSEFGKKFDFENINTIEEFREKVPLSDWEDYEAASKRILVDEPNIMYTDNTSYFLYSSGTSGSVKYIPESNMGAKAKVVTGKMRLAARLTRYPSLMTGIVLPLSNAPAFELNPSGIPIGSASGVTLDGTSEEVKKRLAFPVDVLRIKDSFSIDYMILRFSLEKDVSAIVVNNAARAEQLFKFASKNHDNLINDIENGTINPNLDIPDELLQQFKTQFKPNLERAKELRELVEQNKFEPRFYWKSMLMFSCWLGGSVGRYAEKINEYLPEKCTLFDCGYGASEGKFNIPFESGNPAGTLTIHSAFFEFKSMDNDEIYLAHQLKDKTSYHLILTTYSGLYRYDLHDIVHVDGFTGKTPNIKFETKGDEIGNIAGEKLYSNVIIRAYNNFPNELKEKIKHFAMIPVEKDRHYWFCVEPANDEKLDADLLANLIENELSNESFVYKLFREQGLFYHAKAKIMKPGWQNYLFQTRKKSGQSITQVKLPIIMKDLPDDNLVWI